MKKYKVVYIEDDMYKIIIPDEPNSNYGVIQFRGTIVECNAWIELTVGGYM